MPFCRGWWYSVGERPGEAVPQTRPGRLPQGVPLALP